MTDMNLSMQRIQSWLSHAQLVGDAQQLVQRVHTDTRTLKPGDLFVALKGERFDANTYIALESVMISHDIGRDRGGVEGALATAKVPVVVVSIDTDRLFPSRLQEELARLTPTALPLKRLSSPFGHDGFLIEVESVGGIIRETLEIADSRRS